MERGRAFRSANILPAPDAYDSDDLQPFAPARKRSKISDAAGPRYEDLVVRDSFDGIGGENNTGSFEGFSTETSLSAQYPRAGSIGFTTANFKPVHISEESLRRVKALGLELDYDKAPEPPTTVSTSGRHPHLPKPSAASENTRGRLLSMGFEFEEDDTGATEPGFAKAASAVSFFSSACAAPEVPEPTVRTITPEDFGDGSDGDTEELDFEALLANRKKSGLAPKPIAVRRAGDSEPPRPLLPPSVSASKSFGASATPAAKKQAVSVAPQMRPFKKPQQAAREDPPEEYDGALDFLAEETLALPMSLSSPSQRTSTNNTGVLEEEASIALPLLPTQSEVSYPDLFAGISAEDFQFELNTAEDVPSVSSGTVPVAFATPATTPIKVGSLFLSRTPRPKSFGSGSTTPNIRRHDTSPRGLVDTSIKSPTAVTPTKASASPFAIDRGVGVPKISLPTGPKIGAGAPDTARAGLTRTMAPNPLVATREKISETPQKSKRERRVSYSSKNVGARSSSGLTNECQVFNLECSQGDRITLEEFAISKGRVPAQYTSSELEAYRISQEAIHMTADKAYHYEFKILEEETNTLRSIGPAQLRLALIAAGADSSSLCTSIAWVKNHFKWIIWKLACMERAFPQDFGCAFLTPQRALSQLKYRYEREHNKVHRSAIRKILEQDEGARRHVVLAVVALRWLRGAPISVPPECEGAYSEDDLGALQMASADGAIVEVTDGWYSCHAVLDVFLTQLFETGKLSVGMKLHVALAEVVGSDQAVTPLEMSPSSVMLKLKVNGTKRAAWHARLGVQKRRVFKSSLRSVRPNGGPVPFLDVFVQRAYPILFAETFGPRGAGGVPRTVRTFRGEQRALERYDRKLEILIDSVRARFAAEIEKEHEERKRDCRLRHLTIASDAITNDHDGDSLYQLMLSSLDEEEFARSLPPAWRTRLERCIAQKRLEDEERIQKEIKTAIEENDELNRDSSPLLRLLVVDFTQGARPNLISSAIVSVWRPTRELAQSLREGQRLQLLGASWSFRVSSSPSIADLNLARSAQKESGVPPQLSLPAENIFMRDSKKTPSPSSRPLPVMFFPPLLNFFSRTIWIDSSIRHASECAAASTRLSTRSARFCAVTARSQGRIRLCRRNFRSLTDQEELLSVRKPVRVVHSLLGRPVWQHGCDIIGDASRLAPESFELQERRHSCLPECQVPILRREYAAVPLRCD